MQRKPFILAVMLGLAVLGLGAQEAPATPPTPAILIGFGMSGTYELQGVDPLEPWNSPSTRESFSFGLDSAHFDLIGTMSANSDGAIAPESANLPGGTFGKIYVLMEEGGLRSELGPVTIQAGRLRNHDIIDSPYSLFLNSGGHSTMSATIAYDDGRFFFSTKWLELNRNSAQNTPAWEPNGGGYPDRGANLKVFGLKLGEMRFGFQDAAIYTGRSFDYEYFLNPLPQYFIQYSKTTLGRPWYTGGNENNIIGFFWDWKRPGDFTANVQVLVDDFNVYFLGIGNWNPWKAAVTAGGTLETGFGTLGFHAAGATQYCFQPIDMYNRTAGADIADPGVAAYGYSYYPDTRFNISGDSAIDDFAAIGIEQNAIGYKYGENNFAVQVSWKDQVGGFDLAAAFEFRLAGENSPANPWGDLHHFATGGTRWLADAVLEKRFLLGFDASYRLGSWKLFGSVLGGVALDALRLRAPNGPDSTDGGIENDLWIYAPVKGLNRPLFKLTLGATCNLGF